MLDSPGVGDFKAAQYAIAMYAAALRGLRAALPSKREILEHLTLESVLLFLFPIMLSRMYL